VAQGCGLGPWMAFVRIVAEGEPLALCDADLVFHTATPTVADVAEAWPSDGELSVVITASANLDLPLTDRTVVAHPGDGDVVLDAQGALHTPSFTRLLFDPD